MNPVNGIFAYHYAANPVDRDELVRTREHMAAREPDGMREWFSADGRIGLTHHHQAIIDRTDADPQPMASSDSGLVVALDGTIENFQHLRNRLETVGCVFKTNSDSELLLHLYTEGGEAMVRGLQGMFAFAIWNAERRTLLLARDLHGIKLLYYADDGWTFRFASQVEALLAGGALSRQPDAAGRTGWHQFSSVPAAVTNDREIRALPSGCTLVVDQIGAHAPKPYHSKARVYGQPSW